MTDPVVEALILDLLEWLTAGERDYEEVMNAWRTSCPRLTVWEDANDRGLVARENVKGRFVISVTPSGLALLDRHSLCRVRTEADDENRSAACEVVEFPQNLPPSR